MSNQSIVNLEDIRGGSDLFCLTNYDTGSDQVGSWSTPDGNEVSESGNGLIQNRGRSFVALSYSGFSSPSPGLYRCVIPDSGGQSVTLFAGVYGSGEGRNRTLVILLQHNHECAL